MIEQKIDTLIASIDALTEVLTSGASKTMPAESAKPAAPKAGIAVSKAAAPKAAPAAKGSPKSAPATEGDEYAKVKEATMAFATEKGKDSLAPIFADFGVKTAQSLKPEQYAEYLERLETEMLA